jgi:sulfonate transport system ATP-binding protein
MNTAADPAVRFSNVSKVFRLEDGDFQAIKDLSLDIADGEFIAIVGASGCGKSTLLRLLIGLDREFSGKITLDGQPIAGIGSGRGIIFQEHRLFPWLNVSENIELALDNETLGAEEKRKKVKSLVELVGLENFSRAYPHQLSGGMAQRVAIARGLVTSPRLLLLDEPFGALDALTRQQIQDELLKIRQRNCITTVLVTHDVEEAVYLADRVVVMQPRPGRVKDIVDIDLPRPRQRSGYEFYRLKEELLHMLTRDDRYEPAGRNLLKDVPPMFIAL